MDWNLLHSVLLKYVMQYLPGDDMGCILLGVELLFAALVFGVLLGVKRIGKWRIAVSLLVFACVALGLLVTYASYMRMTGG